MAVGGVGTLGGVTRTALNSCSPCVLADDAAKVSPPADINAVTVYTGFIILLLNVMDGVLDRTVPYQMVWVSSPMLLLLYAFGFFAWSMVAHLMRTGGLAHSTEDVLLFAFFTITIVWLYFKQFTIMWDLLCDWELFLAVARARDFLAPRARARMAVAAAVGRADGHVARVEVLASRGFPPYPQWRAIWGEMAASRTILRLLQCVPLLVVGVLELPVLMLFGLSTVMAQCYVRARTLRWNAALRRPLLAAINVRVDLALVLPCTPAWGVWAFAQAHSEASAEAMLVAMTTSGNVAAARDAALHTIGITYRPVNMSTRELLLTTVIMLVNSRVTEWDWEGAALSPARAVKLATLWAAQ